MHVHHFIWIRKIVITLHFIALYGLGCYLWLRDIVYDIAHDHEAYDITSILRLCLLLGPFFVSSNCRRCISCIINYGIKVQCVFTTSILYNEKESGKWLHHRRLVVLLYRNSAAVSTNWLIGLNRRGWYCRKKIRVLVRLLWACPHWSFMFRVFYDKSDLAVLMRIIYYYN